MIEPGKKVRIVSLNHYPKEFALKTGMTGTVRSVMDTDDGKVAWVVFSDEFEKEQRGKWNEEGYPLHFDRLEPVA